MNACKRNRLHVDLFGDLKDVTHAILSTHVGSSKHKLMPLLSSLKISRYLFCHGCTGWKPIILRLADLGSRALNMLEGWFTMGLCLLLLSFLLWINQPKCSNLMFRNVFFTLIGSLIEGSHKPIVNRSWVFSFEIYFVNIIFVSFHPFINCKLSKQIFCTSGTH